jgi:hypothetical protein
VGVSGNDRLSPGRDRAGEHGIVIRVLDHDWTERHGNDEHDAFPEPLNKDSGIDAGFGHPLRELLPPEHTLQLFEKKVLENSRMAPASAASRTRDGDPFQRRPEMTTSVGCQRRSSRGFRFSALYRSISS